MISISGLPSDYDGWAESGAMGWAWDDVLPFFRNIENDGDFDCPLHGTDGPMVIQLIFDERWPQFTRGFMTAAEEEGWHNIGDNNAVFPTAIFRSPWPTPAASAIQLQPLI